MQRRFPQLEVETMRFQAQVRRTKSHAESPTLAEKHLRAQTEKYRALRLLTPQASDFPPSESV